MARFFTVYDMESLKVIIETPRGSALKYQYDNNSHLFKLKKILPVGMVFPYDFGFLPGTKGEDGDPLDILIVSEFNSFPGCVMECRIIGGFKARQTEKKNGKEIRNDRFFGVPVLSSVFSNVIELKHLPAEKIDQLEEFFIQYNKIEGKDFKVQEKMTSKKSVQLIKESRI